MSCVNCQTSCLLDSRTLIKFIEKSIELNQAYVSLNCNPVQQAQLKYEIVQAKLLLQVIKGY